MERFKQPNQNEAIISSIKEKVLAISRMDSDFTYQEMIAEFAKRLEENYPDHQQYFMYHILLGSSPREAPLNFDFPVEDSVENFINRLYQETQKK